MKNNQSYLLVKDETKLKIPIAPKKYTSDKIAYISELLKEELGKHNGYGLSANQIGLDERICLINTNDEPMILVNPKIIDVSKKKIVYMEQCLSLEKTMKRPVRTVRYESITIECDNLGTVIFESDHKGIWEDENAFWEDKGMLECVCAQHEIDHLNGKLITDKDRRFSSTVTSPKKYGRNERVMVSMPDGTTDFMKYKKALPLLEIGCKIL